MNIGIPREHRPFEYRVGMAPKGLSLLVRHGHICYVEHNAGLGSGFSDEEYQKAGAQIVYSAEEAFLRGEMILKCQRPTDDELQWLREGQILAGFLMLPSARQNKIITLLEKRVTAISYELIEDEHGELPVMKPMSQIGGRMCAQVAACCLENRAGGKGILLGGVPGVPPAEVVIIGAGVVGMEATRAFLGMGASVYVLDHKLRRYSGWTRYLAAGSSPWSPTLSTWLTRAPLPTCWRVASASPPGARPSWGRGRWSG